MSEALGYFTNSTQETILPGSEEAKQPEKKLPALDPRMNQGSSFVYEILLLLAAVMVQDDKFNNGEELFRYAVTAFEKLEHKNEKTVRPFIDGVDDFIDCALWSKCENLDRLTQHAAFSRNQSARYLGENDTLTRSIDISVRKLRDRKRALAVAIPAKTSDLQKTSRESLTVTEEGKCLSDSKSTTEERSSQSLLVKGFERTARSSRLFPARLMAHIRRS